MGGNSSVEKGRICLSAASAVSRDGASGPQGGICYVKWLRKTVSPAMPERIFIQVVQQSL